MDVSVMNRVFETLPENVQIEVFDFMQYLAEQEKRKRRAYLETHPDVQAEKRMAAYQAMLEMKAKSKYPPHIDEKQIKEEAIIAKYGRFD